MLKKLIALCTAVVMLVLFGCTTLQSPAQQSQPAPAAGSQQPSQAAPAPQPKSPYFAGKTITLLVPFPPGGGVDNLARVLAAHLGKHINGNPQVQISNEPAGGGGALGFNQLYTRTAPDGLTIGVASTGVPTRWITGTKGHDYKLNEMAVIAAYGVTNYPVLRTKTARSVQELVPRTEPLRSGQQAGGINSVMDSLGAQLLGYKIRQVTGYTGYGETLLATLRGEVDLTMGTTFSYKQEILPHVTSGDLVALYQAGLLDGAKVIADPRLPTDIPLITDLYRQVYGKDPTQHPIWPGVQAALSVLTLGFSFWLPPGVPPEIYQELVTGFERMQKSQEFLDQADKVLGGPPLATLGNGAQEAFKIFLKMPDDVKKMLK